MDNSQSKSPESANNVLNTGINYSNARLRADKAHTELHSAQQNKQDLFAEFRSKIHAASETAANAVQDLARDAKQADISLTREYITLHTLDEIAKGGEKHFIRYMEHCANVEDSKNHFESTHSELAIRWSLIEDTEPDLPIDDSFRIAFRDARRDFLKLAYPEQTSNTRRSITRRALLQGVPAGLVAGAITGGAAGATLTTALSTNESDPAVRTSDLKTVSAVTAAGGAVAGAVTGLALINNNLMLKEAIPLYQALLNNTSASRHVETLSLEDILDITAKIHETYEQALQSKSEMGR